MEWGTCSSCHGSLSCDGRDAAGFRAWIPSSGSRDTILRAVAAAEAVVSVVDSVWCSSSLFHFLGMASANLHTLKHMQGKRERQAP